MPELIANALVLIAFYAAFAAGMIYLRAANEPPRLRSRAALLTVLAVTAIGSAAYLAVPAVAGALVRDPARVRAGEWWRVATALFGQDGGVAGAISNLVALLLVGYVAARLWDWRRWLLQYFGAGLIAAILAVVWLGVPSAGNSIAVCGLAAGIASGLATVFIRPVQLLAWLSLAAGLVLLAAQDLHGVAYGAGVIIAMLLASRRRA